jgi:hypothetical protein
MPESVLFIKYNYVIIEFEGLHIHMVHYCILHTRKHIKAAESAGGTKFKFKPWKVIKYEGSRKY